MHLLFVIARRTQVLSNNYTMILSEKWKTLSDVELLSLIIREGNEEAVTFLLYNQCFNNLRSITYGYYNSDYFLYDLISELYIHIKKNDWKVLRMYKGNSALKTYIYSVASNLFLAKRKELIGFSEITTPIDKPTGIEPMNTDDLDKRMALLELYNAISELKQESYRTVMLMYLQGYSDAEIAEELSKQKVIKRNKSKDGSLDGDRVSVDYVYTLRSRAKEEISIKLRTKRQKK